MGRDPNTGYQQVDQYLERVFIDQLAGYAFLPRHWSKGYAVEACTAVRDHAMRTLALPRLLAIVSPGNAASVKVLERIGLTFRDTVRMGSQDLQLFAMESAG